MGESEERAGRSTAVRAYGKSEKQKGGGLFARVVGLGVLTGSFCLSWNPAWAELTLSLEAESVRVAEPLALTVTSDTPGLTWPDWAEALPGWDVVVQHVDDQAVTLTLRSYLPGALAVPAITATTPGGVTFATEPRTVAVASVLPDDADVTDAGVLKPEAGVLQVSTRRGLTGIPTLAAEAAAATVGVLALMGWLRRRARRAAPAARVDQALRAADEHGDAAQAVWAVRRAAELACGQNLRAQTATDLMDDQNTRALFSPGLHGRIVAFLREAEAALHGPCAPDQRTGVIKAAHGLVKETRSWAIKNPLQNKAGA